MSNMDGQMMPKWTQMKTWIPWAIWMDKWCQNELKWRLKYHEQYGWTNDAKMNSNEDLNPMSNMDGRMMPKCTQMKTWIPWAILMDKWCQNELKWTQMKTWKPWAIWMDKWFQNELKWRVEYHEQYGWTNDAKINSNEDRWRLEFHGQYGSTNYAKMNSNEDLNPMNNIYEQMMQKWTQMNSNEDLNLMSNMHGQMIPKWTQMKTRIPWAIWMDTWCQNELKWKVQYHGNYGWTNDAKWTQMKTWIPWAIWVDKWCQNELKWRLESHVQYWWTNDAKMNSNEDSNIMSNMDGQMMPKWTQMKTWIPWAIWMDKWCLNELKWRLKYHEQYGWTNDAKMSSNEDLNPMSNMDGQMMPKWTQMKTWIPWAIWMDKWCQNEESNPMSNMDGQMMPKWSQMKTWIPWAIWMDKWCQNILKWRLESHVQYGWTNDAKMNSNEDSNIMSNMDGQMMPKWTQMKTWIPWAIWMVKWCQNEFKWKVQYHGHYGWTNDAKWTQMKTWIPWAIWMDKWCQYELKWWLESHVQYWCTNDAKMNSNELKWRLEFHEQYGSTNYAKMNSNEDLNPMNNIYEQMMQKLTQMNSNKDLNLMSNMHGQMIPKWTQMKTRIPWAIWMDKWCQNELKWRLESHEQYGWTNDAKINSTDNSNIMSNMGGQMLPKWTQMKTWIPCAILMDKWCQNELKWKVQYHGNYGWTNDAKWTQMKTWIPWAIWVDKWCQNELKWRLESHVQYWWTNDAKMNSNELKWRLKFHEQYGWTNDGKMNSNEALNPMSNMDGQMMPKWTQMKTQISWAIWMDKWCQNELKWRLESHEQYGWTNDAKMKSRIPWAIWMDKWCQNDLKWRLESHEQYGWTNDAKIYSNEDLNPMCNMDGQMMPKWTQMKTQISWAIWMDKWCQNELKWRLESHEQYGWSNDAKMNSNEKFNIMGIMDGQMMQNEPKWRLEYHEQYGWTNDANMNSNEDLNPMCNIDVQMMPKWTQMN